MAALRRPHRDEKAAAVRFVLFGHRWSVRTRQSRVPARSCGSHAGRASVHGSSGQDVVEYALILPVLLLFLFGIVEFGWAVFSYNTVANAAREVARCCIYSPTAQEMKDHPTWVSICGSLEDPAARLGDCEQAAIDRFSKAVSLEATNFGYTPDPAARTIQVTVDYTHHLITGYVAGVLGISPPVIDMHTAATMRVE